MSGGEPPARTMPDWERATDRPHAVIVSDDADLRDFLGQGLLFSGFWTSVIGSGIQVIEVFRLRAFDLVVLDARISGLGAAEIVRRLRAPSEPDGSPLTDAPVALIDDRPAVSDADDADDAGPAVELVVRPPFEVVDLAVALHGVVRDWRLAHPGRPLADAPRPQVAPRYDVPRD